MGIHIARRFRGPPESGNGGYSCGVVASLLDGPSEVTLRSPPPLDVPFEVEREGDGVRVLASGQLVADARAITLEITPPAAPSFAEASDATQHYLWWKTHPYPMCFVCGPERPPGDGLCIFPAAVAGRDVAAAPFVPDDTLVDESGRVRPEIVWAALDCPSWFGYACFHPHDPSVLLGRLAARIDGRPRAGERCVVVGWFLGKEGRKISCGSALYGESGAPLAVARATWINLK